MERNATFADVKKNGIRLSKSLDPAEVARLEAKLGRKLTTREVLFGELDREDTRSREQRMDMDGWKPKLAEKKHETIYDAALEEAITAVKSEELQKMTPAQRRLRQIQEAHDAELRKQADAEAHVEQLKKLEPQIRRLNEMRERVKWDPSFTFADILQIDRALEQLTLPGGDMNASIDLYDAAIKVELTRKTEKRDAVLSKMNELGAQKAELDAALRALSGKPATYDEALEESLWQEYKNVENSGDEAAKTAAFNCWESQWDLRPKDPAATSTEAAAT
jgi:hypothetical protein